MNHSKKTRTPQPTGWMIEKVENLPESHFRKKQEIYTTILREIQESRAGIYKIRIPSKRPATILNVLRKRVRTQNMTNLKAYIRNQEIYIQKT